MIKLIVIKHPKGCYISFGQNIDANKFIVNGEPVQPTFDRQWVSVSAFPEKIQRYDPQPRINYRYVLIDASMASDKIPLEFKREDVAEYHDYSWYFKEEYANLRSLYNEISDAQPDAIVDCEFEIESIIEMDHEAVQAGKFAYPVYRTQWTHDGLKNITNENLRHRLLDEIEVPSIYLEEQPCKLSSKQTYDIIRQHVIQHLDRKVASITSDYDFCFTVKKNIPLAIPEKYKVDINLWDNLSRIGTKKRKKPAKYEDRYRHVRQVEVFEMTHDEKSYCGYTIMPGIEGTDPDDLKRKMDAYLESLMDFLNEPVCECEACKGLGVVFEKFEGKPE